MTQKPLSKNQIDELQKIYKTAAKASTSHKAFAILQYVRGGDMSLCVYTVDHARRLKRSYLNKGVEALNDQRKTDRHRVLSAPEKRHVIDIIKTKLPKEVMPGCSAEYWTTGLLGSYIEDKFGKKYKSKTSSYLLFKEAKLTWHKPGKVYEKSNPEAKAAWIETIQPILEKYWQEKDTVVLCEDEMVLTAKTTTQKVWLPSGKYPPIVEVNGRSKNKSFYGFLNLKTGQENAFITDWQNMYITVEILKKIRKVYPTQKLVIIWDNAGWHRGSKVQEWIEADKNTETIHFPAYTPDLNPQEHVWKAGRKEVTHNQFIDKIEETAEKFKGYIESQRFAYELLGFRASCGQV